MKQPGGCRSFGSRTTQRGDPTQRAPLARHMEGRFHELNANRRSPKGERKLAAATKHEGRHPLQKKRSLVSGARKPVRNMSQTFE